MEWTLAIPWSVVREEAEINRLDPNLIAAIISVESSGDTYQIRYEIKFTLRNNPDKFARMNNITEETENLLQSCSIGLMQVLGCTARDLGFSKNLLQLTDEELGIEYGCKYLAKLFLKYSSLDDIISSYRHGHVSKNSKGDYVNQRYVNKVLERLKTLSERI